ncbi:hypothetical protein ROZALSC1DRAFT_24931 [Rozella allomycis CSF55]|uniref:Uncharacterized protein n=1 Tax=Rozella allomycis (strain CSF55) TaxID=988480 RepID=A0A4P9YCA9_ROZAC|nr:hypothetical protein ROZALSC1DRAFT_24931 [Rozella allomycis CSF55]
MDNIQLPITPNTASLKRVDVLQLKSQYFDEFLVSTIIYFKWYLKNLHDKFDGGWVMAHYKGHVSKLNGGFFGGSSDQENKLEEALKNLGLMYSKWLITTGHSLRLDEERNLCKVTIKLTQKLVFMSFMKSFVKIVFTNRQDSQIIDQELTRLFQPTIRLNRQKNFNNASQQKSSHDHATVFETFSPLISMLYPKPQSQNVRKINVIGNTDISSISFPTTSEAFNYENIEAYIGEANLRFQRQMHRQPKPQQ